MNIRIAKKIVTCVSSLSNNPEKLKQAKDVMIKACLARWFDQPSKGEHFIFLW